VSRTADIARKTGETDIRISLALDGAGAGTRRTGVGFFDHLLDAFARHGGFDLEVEADGDLETGAHHTVEDTGIAIGQALDEALGDRSGIVRFGHAVVPMDEVRAAASIDVSGRPYTSVDGPFEGSVEGFDPRLLEEFVRGVANNAKLTVHIAVEREGDMHHLVEASMKAFARALRQAVAIDPAETGVPSTKGLL
jgi:imidazoleglycerol-phosphate dehydratase